MVLTGGVGFVVWWSGVCVLCLRGVSTLGINAICVRGIQIYTSIHALRRVAKLGGEIFVLIRSNSIPVL